jgi:hypothetical protein
MKSWVALCRYGTIEKSPAHKANSHRSESPAVVSLDFQSKGYAFSLTILDGDSSAEGLRWKVARHEFHWAVCQQQVCDLYLEYWHGVIMWAPVNKIYYAFSFCQAVHWMADLVSKP